MQIVIIVACCTKQYAFGRFILQNLRKFLIVFQVALILFVNARKFKLNVLLTTHVTYKTCIEILTLFLACILLKVIRAKYNYNLYF